MPASQKSTIRLELGEHIVVAVRIIVDAELHFLPPLTTAKAIEMEMACVSIDRKTTAVAKACVSDIAHRNEHSEKGKGSLNLTLMLGRPRAIGG